MALENIPEIGPHAYAEGGIEGVASNLGISVEEYRRKLRADGGAHAARMNGGHGGKSDVEAGNNHRAGIVYKPWKEPWWKTGA
jgi:hypothetical protein